MTIGKVEADLVFNTKKGKAQLRNDLEDVGKKSGAKVGANFSKAFIAAGVVGSILLIKRGIGELTSVVRDSVKAAASLEAFETQFATILKSTQAAQRQLQELRDFAATTPFQLPGLVTSTRQLLSFGVEQQKIIPTLRQLGDLAAGVGANIDELVIPFGRLVSTQKLTLVELDKFSDRGINLYKELAEGAGVSINANRDDISKGRIDFDEFTKALNRLTGQGGLFFNATQRQAKTLTGLFSTFEDNIFNLQGTIGRSLVPVVKKALEDAIKLVQGFNKTFAENGDAIINKVFDIARSASFLIKPFQIAFNFLKTSFLGLKTIISAAIAGIASVAENQLTPIFESFAKVPGKVGQKAKSALQQLQLFGQAARDTFSEESAAFGESIVNIFETGNIDAKIRSTIERYREAGLTSQEIFAKIAKDAKDSTESAAKEINSLGQSLNNLLGNQVANSIAQLSKSLAEGEDIFKAFGQAAIGLIADFAIQAGKIYVAKGIADLALFSSPGASIAAGAALIAVGTLAKTFFSSGGDASSPAGVGGGPLPTQPEFAATEPEEREDPETRVQVVVNGSVFDSDETGLRISKILEESALNNNVRIVGGIA